MTRNPILFALCAVALAACQPVADSALDPDTLSMDELALTVDTSIDQLDATAQDGETADVLGDLEVDPQDETTDRSARREFVRRLVTRLAQDEPCALRGVLAGRTRPLDDSAVADGALRGRAYRRGEGLVARGEGTYVATEDGGGSWAAVWENFEGATGTADGSWQRGGRVEGIRLGTFDGQWDGDDGDGFGNVAGLWHPTRDGRSVFVGYWSNCNAAPADASQ